MHTTKYLSWSVIGDSCSAISQTNLSAPCSYCFRDVFIKLRFVSSISTFINV